MRGEGFKLSIGMQVVGQGSAERQRMRARAVKKVVIPVVLCSEKNKAERVSRAVSQCRDLVTGRRPRSYSRSCRGQGGISGGRSGINSA